MSALARPQDYQPSPLELDRQAYRRTRARRSNSLAALSTAVVAVAVWLVLSHSPGWSRFRSDFFNLKIAESSFRPILDGLWLNVRVLVVTETIVLVLALLVAVLRTTQGPVTYPFRLAALIYVEVFRGLPLLIVLYLVGLGLPALRIAIIPNSLGVLGTAALVLTYTAYVSEVFRAGIQSVHPSQRAAARSLGLTYAQTLRLVVLPQAVRRVLPPLLNDFVSLQKDVGLISVIGAVDAIRAAQIIQTQIFNFTPYVVAGLMFVALAVPSGRIADYVGARARRREQAAGTV